MHTHPALDAYAYYLERLGVTLPEIRAMSERLGVDAQALLVFVAQQRGISEAEVSAQFSMQDAPQAPPVDMSLLTVADPPLEHDWTRPVRVRKPEGFV